MADRGIIFSAAMVRALLDGRKTQTRRLLNPQPLKWEARVIDITEPYFNDDEGAWGQSETIWNRNSAMWEPEREVFRPLRLAHKPGDRLYVREAFSYAEHLSETVWYWADGNVAAFDCGKPKPSIHMPRWASRLTLLVTDVRVQRLQDISEADAASEGALLPWTGTAGSACDDTRTARSEFSALWDSLHTAPGTRWEDNPWIYAVSFDVRHGNIDQIGGAV